MFSFLKKFLNGKKDELQKNKQKKILIYSNNDQYIGELIDGNIREGVGSYIYANGDRYEGEWKQDLKHGKGRLFYQNGEIYIGGWKENKKHGQGSYFYKTGDRYEGQWKDNMKEGFGIFYLTDQTQFEGQFHKNKKHGKGILTLPTGKQIEEQWEEGKLRQSRSILGEGLYISLQEGEAGYTGLKRSKTLNLQENVDIQEKYKFKEEQTIDKNNNNFIKSLDSRFFINQTKTEEQNAPNLYQSSAQSLSAINDHDKQFNYLYSNESLHSKNYDDIGIETLEQMELLNSLAELILDKDINEWNQSDLIEWLSRIGLSQYQQQFISNHITAKHLLDLSESDLKDELGITSIGHRKDLMKAIEHLRKMYKQNLRATFKKRLLTLYEKNKQIIRSRRVRQTLTQAIPKKRLYFSEVINEEGDDDSGTDSSKSKQRVKIEQNEMEMLLLPQNQNTKSKSKEQEKGSEADNEENCQNENENEKDLISLEIERERENLGCDSISSSSQKSSSSPLQQQQQQNKVKSPLVNQNDNFEFKEDLFQLNHEQQQQQQQQNLLVNYNHKIKHSQTQNTQASDYKEENKIHESTSSSSSSSSSSDDALKKIHKKLSPVLDPHDCNNLIPIPKLRKASSTNEKQLEGKKKKKRRKHKRIVEKTQYNGMELNHHIIKILKESGLNRSFVIDYKELKQDKKIGEGGYGEVYLGYWLGQSVAIKQYGKRYSKQTTKLMDDFLKEVNVVSNLRHPNIVLYMGICVNYQNRYLMIAEYLENGSLYDHLHKQNEKITEDRLIAICEDIALGMTYLHGRKILHCDLKSSNILIDQNWNIKLCDFGLSAVKSKIDKKQKGGRIGTPHWMAPEILREEKYDEKSDVYSFGMVLWEMITGEIPYKNYSVWQIIASVGYDKKQVDIPKNGNQLILNILKQCLSFERKDRPTFKQILKMLQNRDEKLDKINQIKMQLGLFFGEQQD